MTRRQFIAACLMLIVAACLLDLERLREWWANVRGEDIDAFANSYEIRMGSYPILCGPPVYISMDEFSFKPGDYSGSCPALRAARVPSDSFG